MWPLFLLALALLGLGVWLLAHSQRLRRATGLPSGEIVYIDASRWRRNQRAYFSPRHRLAGKPDYLVADGDYLIPVEVKSTHLRGGDPYDSHKLQLAAYCLLLAETAAPPPYGILKYADATVRIPYTPALQAELLRTLAQMRHDLTAGNLRRSHEDRNRCHNCGYRDACGEEQLF